MNSKFHTTGNINNNNSIHYSRSCWQYTYQISFRRFMITFELNISFNRRQQQQCHTQLFFFIEQIPSKIKWALNNNNNKNPWRETNAEMKLLMSTLFIHQRIILSTLFISLHFSSNTTLLYHFFKFILLFVVFLDLLALHQWLAPQ